MARRAYIRSSAGTETEGRQRIMVITLPMFYLTKGTAGAFPPGVRHDSPDAGGTGMVR
jgi:hypothetical protein